MSERRTILSRPRTKVYESNYNIGESYYKPMVDHLDRKYSGRPLLSPSPPREFRTSRRALDEEFLRDPAFERASQLKNTDFFERSSNALKEADAFFDRHGRRTEADSFLDRSSTSHAKSEAQEFFDKAVSKTEESFAEKSQNLRNKADQFFEKAKSETVSATRASALDDEFDDEIAAQLKRIKASRAARDVARDDEMDFAINGIRPTPHLLKYKYGFTDKMLDTVGIDGRYQDKLVEDIIRRRTEVPLHFPEEQLPAFPIVGKWTKINNLSEEEKSGDLLGLDDVQLATKLRLRYGILPTIKYGYTPLFH